MRLPNATPPAAPPALGAGGISVPSALPDAMVELAAVAVERVEEGVMLTVEPTTVTLVESAVVEEEADVEAAVVVASDSEAEARLEASERADER